MTALGTRPHRFKNRWYPMGAVAMAVRDSKRMARRNGMQGSKRFDEMTTEILAENLGVLKERYQKWKKQWEEETK